MSSEGVPPEEELDQEWESLEPAEQDALREEFNDFNNWSDLSYDEKAVILGYEPPSSLEPDGEEEDEGGGQVSDASQLAVEDVTELVGNNSGTVRVAGHGLQGATQVTMSGEGYESQYLREIEEGGDGGNEHFSNAPSDDDGGSGSDSEDGGGEEPPLRIVIEGTMGQHIAEEMVNLREQDELFEVDVFGETYSDMELHDFTRELTGERPYAYEFRIEVVEWREVEIMDPPNEHFGNSDSESGGEAGNPGAEAEDEFDDGTEDDPQEYTIEAGEQRNFHIGENDDASYAVIDTTADGAESIIYADGSSWMINNVGWRGPGGGIVPRGTGTIDTVYMGDGGMGIVGELNDTVNIQDVNLQETDNGIHLTDGTMDDL